MDGILRRSLYALPPISIVFYEHLIGFLLLLPFLIRTIKEGGSVQTSDTVGGFTKKEWVALFAVSFLSSVLGTLWFTTALQKTSFIPFSVVFLLQKLQPVFAVSSARIFLKERIAKGYAIWAMLALVSAYFVTFPNGNVNFQTGAGTAVAALFAIGAAFAWGTSTALSRFVLLNRSRTIVTGIRFGMATVLSFIVALTLGITVTETVPIDTQWLYLLAIALSTGMVALLIYYEGLKHTPVHVATILELVFPLVAVFIDIFLYETVLAPTQYLAALVLLFAVQRVARLSTTGETRKEI
jgi:drug/metabolite transporter (DMT)-like permease